MGCRNEEGSSSLNAIVPVHDFAQHKIISMKKKHGCRLLTVIYM